MFKIEKIYTYWGAERLTRHLIYWLFWLVLYATVNTSNNPNSSFFTWLWVELSVMSVKVPFTYMMIYVLVPHFLIQRKYLQFACLAVLGAIIGGFTISGLYYLRLAVLIGYPQPSVFLTPGIFFKVLDLLYVSTFPTIYKLYQFYRKAEIVQQEMNAQKLNAELELLKNQLQPHFLFNTLNNLYGMILTNDKNAAPAVLRLSNIMSYMLYECNSPFIALEKEVEHLKAYIELEQIRYGKRLEVSFECGGAMNKHQIAPLLLIGFVENAFKHGAGSHNETAWIRINLWVENGQMDFIIENNLPTKISENENFKVKSGIGLRNIHQRLALIYPDQYTLKIEQSDSFLVHLKLNLHHNHATMPHH
jgi:two-component system, LytTR family, sensor kinase